MVRLAFVLARLFVGVWTLLGFVLMMLLGLDLLIDGHISAFLAWFALSLALLLSGATVHKRLKCS